MNKPLIRWTIGGNTMPAAGIEVLSHSVEQVKMLYPEVDLAICFNNLTPIHENQVGIIAERHGASLVSQKLLTYPIKPTRAEWLLWPARLRIYAHEILMDNDIVLLRRHPIIDEFLSDNKGDLFFASEGIHKLPYGNYRDMCPQNPLVCSGAPVNSGLFGLPPYFDSDNAYKKFYDKFGPRPYLHTNPQGVVAYMIKTHNHKIISKRDILVAGTGGKGSMIKDKHDLKKIYGIHFVGINRRIYINWRIYCSIVDRKAEFSWLPPNKTTA